MIRRFSDGIRFVKLTGGNPVFAKEEEEGRWRQEHRTRDPQQHLPQPTWDVPTFGARQWPGHARHTTRARGVFLALEQEPPTGEGISADKDPAEQLSRWRQKNPDR